MQRTGLLEHESFFFPGKSQYSSTVATESSTTVNRSRVRVICVVLVDSYFHSPITKFAVRMENIFLLLRTTQEKQREKTTTENTGWVACFR